MESFLFQLVKRFTLQPDGAKLEINVDFLVRMIAEVVTSTPADLVRPMRDRRQPLLRKRFDISNIE